VFAILLKNFSKNKREYNASLSVLGGSTYY
jgi:hypothetical protein